MITWPAINFGPINLWSMPKMAAVQEDGTIIFERIIHEDEVKMQQVRLVASEFRDKVYIQLRRYYMSYDEGYIPTREGISMEMTVDNVFSLLDGLIELCSKAEAEESITRYFSDKILDLQNKTD